MVSASGLDASPLPPPTLPHRPLHCQALPLSILVSGSSALLSQMGTRELALQGPVKGKAVDPTPSLVLAKGHYSHP